MSLQSIIERSGKQAKAVAEEIKETDPRFDRYLLSKAVNGLTRLTPEQYKALCTSVKCDPSEGYTPQEVDYGISTSGAPRTAKKDGHRLRHKFTVRLTDEAKFWLQPQILQSLGYPSKTAWFYACLRRLEAEYAARHKNVKKVAVGAASPRVKDGNITNLY